MDSSRSEKEQDIGWSEHNNLANRSAEIRKFIGRRKEFKVHQRQGKIVQGIRQVAAQHLRWHSKVLQPDTTEVTGSDLDPDSEGQGSALEGVNLCLKAMWALTIL